MGLVGGRRPGPARAQNDVSAHAQRRAADRCAVPVGSRTGNRPIEPGWPGRPAGTQAKHPVWGRCDALIRSVWGAPAARRPPDRPLSGDSGCVTAPALGRAAPGGCVGAVRVRGQRCSWRPWSAAAGPAELVLRPRRATRTCVASARPTRPTRNASSPRATVLLRSRYPGGPDHAGAPGHRNCRPRTEGPAAESPETAGPAELVLRPRRATRTCVASATRTCPTRNANSPGGAAPAVSRTRGDLADPAPPPRGDRAQSGGRPSSRAISMRWTSEVPSPISRILASR